MNRDVGEADQLVAILPSVELRELIRTHYQVERRGLAQSREEVADRFDRVRAAGAANLDINQPGLTQETRFAASAGIGAKIPFNPHVGLRLELKGYYTSLDDGGDDCHSCYYDYYGNDLYQGETNIGLVITF